MRYIAPLKQQELIRHAAQLHKHSLQVVQHVQSRQAEYRKGISQRNSLLT